MRWIRPLGNAMIPSLLFYGLYQAAGILTAIIISLAYSLTSAIYSKFKEGSIKNTQIWGILGLAASAAAVFFSGDEKLYYIPAVLQNALFLGFMIVLSVQHKSVFHHVAKDFEIKSLEQIPEESMFSVNAVWMIYFAIKLISKIVGILYWDFEKLYWIVFLLGDPMTILVVMLSVLFIRLQLIRGRREGE